MQRPYSCLSFFSSSVKPGYFLTDFTFSILGGSSNGSSPETSPNFEMSVLLAGGLGVAVGLVSTI
tara:strand:- start:320 stop:514 length:195 start_codon:yes stop_codon:yes gene_type:complete